MNTVNIPVQQLDEGLQLPQCAYTGDAGVDLRATVSMTIPAGERALIPTGIAIELPEGYAGLVVPRSGLAIKHGITVVNAPGLIDTNYRGEIKVILANTDKDSDFIIERGDRVAQLLVVPFATPNFIKVETLSETDRGAGGFGSSGVSA